MKFFIDTADIPEIEKLIPSGLIDGVTTNPSLIAKNGKEKYMKYFNSTVVADYIINNTFNFKYNKNKFMWSNK